MGHINRKALRKDPNRCLANIWTCRNLELLYLGISIIVSQPEHTNYTWKEVLNSISEKLGLKSQNKGFCVMGNKEYRIVIQILQI